MAGGANATPSAISFCAERRAGTRTCIATVVLSTIQIPAASHPDRMRAAIRRARQLLAEGKLDAAVDANRAVLDRNPGACTCWSNLGVALFRLGRKDEALDVLQHGAGVCPESVDLAYNLGLALLGVERFDQAVDHCRTGLQRCPDNAKLYHLLGRALAKLRQPDAAATAWRRAVSLAPTIPHYRQDLAAALRGLARYAEGERELRVALSQAPDSPDVLAALAQNLISLGLLDSGLEYCNKALAIAPDHVNARMARARANFLAGRYAAAWSDYRWRRHRETWSGMKVAGRGWEGQDIAGQSILLYGEQGLGDVIQFARYAPLLAQRGSQVVLYCPVRLTGLLQRLPGVARVIPGDRPHPRTDWVCSLLDVPGIWEADLDSIPASPYLAARPRARPLLPPTRKRRIGIVWAGNSAQQDDRQRSCRVDDFAPLLELPGTEFISFQVGPRARELRTSGWLGLINQAGQQVVPFDATADALLEVDLVITVDTAMAHLAGALGRPVWTLLAFAPDWRWMLDRADTPWYPTMRLFRQPKPNDWAGVFREVRRELAADASGPAGRHARPTARRSDARSPSSVAR